MPKLNKLLRDGHLWVTWSYLRSVFVPPPYGFFFFIFREHPYVFEIVAKLAGDRRRLCSERPYCSCTPSAELRRYNTQLRDSNEKSCCISFDRRYHNRITLKQNKFYRYNCLYRYVCFCTKRALLAPFLCCFLVKLNLFIFVHFNLRCC